MADPLGMRHGHHTRRAAPDPLAPIAAPVWVVTRDMCGQLIERHELPASADQRAALVAARDARIADGWHADEIGPHSAHFFASRADQRIVTAIERDPMRKLR